MVFTQKKLMPYGGKAVYLLIEQKLLRSSDKLHHSEDCHCGGMHEEQKTNKKSEERKRETLTYFQVADQTNLATVVVPWAQP